VCAVVVCVDSGGFLVYATPDAGEAAERMGLADGWKKKKRSHNKIVLLLFFLVVGDISFVPNQNCINYLVMKNLKKEIKG